MSVIQSQIKTDGAEFIANKNSMVRWIAKYRAVEQKVLDKTNACQKKFHQRGQLLPHQRIKRLLDSGASFLEIASLAGHLMHGDQDGTGAGGNLIAGIGLVSGIRCMVVANNSAIKGGAIAPATLKKTLLIQRIALDNKLPLVSLTESAGANLNHATDIFVEGARAFANQARLSAAGIPQITVVHGSSTAGGAYQPGLSDYVIMVRKQAKMFLAGPPLLKAATGEIASDEALGGAQMHAQETGTADYLAQDDEHAIAMAREIMANLPWQCAGNQQKPNFQAPVYSPQELIGVVPVEAKTPYDVREILARILDGSEFVEFKSHYDRQTICGHGAISGFNCGLIGNNGPITPKGAQKAAQFIQLCEQSHTPLIFLQNTTGFMVGVAAERAGVIKHGSKMLQAVANAQVAKITLLVGGSYGAGNYAMCGRGLDPRFIFAWPNSRTAVMGGKQAGQVLRGITEQKQRRAGLELDGAAIAQLQALEQSTEQRIEQESTALYASAHLWDDGLIDPRDSRKLLSLLLEICREAEHKSLYPSHFGVARF